MSSVGITSAWLLPLAGIVLLGILVWILKKRLFQAMVSALDARKPGESDRLRDGNDDLQALLLFAFSDLYSTDPELARIQRRIRQLVVAHLWFIGIAALIGMVCFLVTHL